MRIAMIDPSLFTLPYDRDLAGGLEQAGHEAVLYGRRRQPDDGDPGTVDLRPAFYPISGGRAGTLRPRILKLVVKALEHPVNMIGLLRRLKRMRPDVIHFQWLPLPLVDACFLAALRRIAPLVLTVHDTLPFNGDPSVRLQAAGFRRCLAAFDRLIVHTEQGRDRMVAQGIAADRLHVVPLGMTSDRTGRDTGDQMQGPLTFLLFGKLKPYKGADLLIEAFAALPDALRQQARVRIVGKPYMDLVPMLDRIRDLGLEQRIGIEPAFVAEGAIPSLLAPGTIAVFPYREIEASGVLGQVLSHGRPVIASRMGLFKEMLTDGVHGHLVPPKDVAALARSLAHFIEDRDFAAACSRDAGTLADAAPAWSTVAKQTVQVYQAAGALSREAGRPVTPAPSHRAGRSGYATASVTDAHSRA